VQVGIEDEIQLQELAVFSTPLINPVQEEGINSPVVCPTYVGGG